MNPATHPQTPAAAPVSALPAPDHPTMPLNGSRQSAPPSNPPSANGRRPPTKAKLRSKKQLVSVAVVAVLALTLLVWGGKHWLFAGSSTHNEITATVSRTDLPVIITERGALESARTDKAKCEVEGRQCKIAFLLPEGTKVKKDEVVVRFDTDEIRRGVAEQEIKFKTADGKAKQAKEELDVQKNKAEGEIAKAKLTLDLAVLDREKYLEGEYKVEVDDKKS